MIAGIGIILLASSLIFYTSKLTTLAADEIIMAMDQANRGDLSVRIVLDRTDEFGRIALSFNQMISRMQALINQVRQAERLKREAEISALEAQINPHFLYNTLDAINWVAIDRNQPIISEMLKNLATILRYSISKSNTEVPLGQEIAYLRRYIYLQQTRCNYRFICLIDVPEELLTCRIHKLLLQPLLENCLEHGLVDQKDEGLIHIKARLVTADLLEIMIADNGKGMQAAAINAFNSGHKLPGHAAYQQDQHGIGLENVRARMRIYYGNQGAFRLEPAQPGLRAILRLPCRPGHNSNEKEAESDAYHNC